MQPRTNPDAAAASLLRTNLLVQLSVFLPLVQLPALATSRMAYVDIGWPCGLVAMGCTALAWGEGWWLRRWAVSTLVILHGGRMFLGALVLSAVLVEATGGRLDEAELGGREAVVIAVRQPA